MTGEPGRRPRRTVDCVRRWLREPGRFAEDLRRLFDPTRRSYRRLFRMTLRDWFLHHHRHVVFGQCSWMGVRTLKNPLDAWIYQEILHEVRPEVVIEIGSHVGGSTLYFAHLLDLLGAGIVISIDVDRTHFAAEHPRIVTITGDSADPKIVAEVARLAAGKRTLAIHDGDHVKDQVLRDLSAYSGMVSVGSYFIVEDGVIDLFDAGDGIGTRAAGPLAAVREFLRQHANFVVDRGRERYILTFSPMGFLKRVS